MISDDLKYQIALTLIPKIGAITAKKLIAYLGSPQQVFMEKQSALCKIPGVGDYLAGRVNGANYVKMAEEEIEAMKKSNISCVYYMDENYPWRLKNCDDGPLLLYYRGNPDFNRTKFLSVVGTRSATAYGREMCQGIISELAARHPELVIVSGLAYGIDITAHRAALENKIDTFAIMAHGLNTVYPYEHANMAGRILKQGCIASDFHSSIKPERNNFLRRNRIIAGLSEGTLVIESGTRGGAMVTADIASSYSREVFAVPGRTTDHYSAGCNNLIQKNIAALVKNAADIEDLLGWKSSEKPAKAPGNLLTRIPTREEELILKAITEEPELGQEIISIRTGIPLHQITSTLLQMELQGMVTVIPGNLYKPSVRILGQAAT